MVPEDAPGDASQRGFPSTLCDLHEGGLMTSSSVHTRVTDNLLHAGKHIMVQLHSTNGCRVIAAVAGGLCGSHEKHFKCEF